MTDSNRAKERWCEALRATPNSVSLADLTWQDIICHALTEMHERGSPAPPFLASAICEYIKNNSHRYFISTPDAKEITLQVNSNLEHCSSNLFSCEGNSTVTNGLPAVKKKWRLNFSVLQSATKERLPPRAKQPAVPTSSSSSTHQPLPPLPSASLSQPSGVANTADLPDQQNLNAQYISATESPAMAALAGSIHSRATPPSANGMKPPASTLQMKPLAATLQSKEMVLEMVECFQLLRRSNVLERLSLLEEILIQNANTLSLLPSQREALLSHYPLRLKPAEAEQRQQQAHISASSAQQPQQLPSDELTTSTPTPTPSRPPAPAPAPAALSSSATALLLLSHTDSSSPETTPRTESPLSSARKETSPSNFPAPPATIQQAKEKEPERTKAKEKAAPPPFTSSRQAALRANAALTTPKASLAAAIGSRRSRKEKKETPAASASLPPAQPSSSSTATDTPQLSSLLSASTEGANVLASLDRLDIPVPFVTAPNPNLSQAVASASRVLSQPSSAAQLPQLPSAPPTPSKTFSDDLQLTPSVFRHTAPTDVSHHEMILNDVGETAFTDIEIPHGIVHHAMGIPSSVPSTPLTLALGAPPKTLLAHLESVIPSTPPREALVTQSTAHTEPVVVDSDAESVLYSHEGTTQKRRRAEEVEEEDEREEEEEVAPKRPAGKGAKKVPKSLKTKAPAEEEKEVVEVPDEGTLPKGLAKKSPKRLRVRKSKEAEESQQNIADEAVSIAAAIASTSSSSDVRPTSEKTPTRPSETPPSDYVDDSNDARLAIDLSRRKSPRVSKPAAPPPVTPPTADAATATQKIVIRKSQKKIAAAEEDLSPPAMALSSPVATSPLPPLQPASRPVGCTYQCKGCGKWDHGVVFIKSITDGGGFVCPECNEADIEKQLSGLT